MSVVPKPAESEPVTEGIIPESMPDLDDSDSKLVDFLKRKYRGDDLGDYIGSCLSLNRSIEDPKVKKYLVDSFVGEEPAEEERKYAQEEFLKRSIITQEVRPFSGTSKLTERLYDNNVNPDEHPIDYQITKMPSAQATKHRLSVIEGEIKEAIKYAVDDLNKGVVKVIDWGSGPGRYSYEVARDLAGTPYGEAAKFTLFDIDREALSTGEKRTREMGVYDKFEFVRGNLRDVISKGGSKDNDIGILSGILCSLPKKVKWGSLRGLRSHLSPDGCLISASSSRKMKRDDPYLDHWRREQGFWPLDYVSPFEMKVFHRLAGYWGKLHTTDDNPWGHYVIIRGYVKNPRGLFGLKF